MWRLWCALNNASKWQMGFNSAFKGLIQRKHICEHNMHEITEAESQSIKDETNQLQSLSLHRAFCSLFQ